MAELHHYPALNVPHSSGQPNGHAVGVQQQVGGQGDLHHPVLNVPHYPGKLQDHAVSVLEHVGGQGEHHHNS